MSMVNTSSQLGPIPAPVGKGHKGGRVRDLTVSLLCPIPNLSVTITSPPRPHRAFSDLISSHSPSQIALPGSPAHSVKNSPPLSPLPSLTSQSSPCRAGADRRPTSVAPLPTSCRRLRRQSRRGSRPAGTPVRLSPPRTAPGGAGRTGLAGRLLRRPAGGGGCRAAVCWRPVARRAGGPLPAPRRTRMRS